MSTKNVYERFEKLNKGDKIVCTQEDLDEFLMYGIVLKSGDNYMTRANQKLNIDILKVKTLSFNLNFSSIINECEKLSGKTGEKKIYCLSEKTFDKYMSEGLIVHKNNNDYFRVFDKELWLVYKI